MDIKRCPNGHFYDSEKYVECPHCDEKAEVVVHKNQQEKTDKSNSKKKAQPTKNNLSGRLFKRERTYSGENTISYQQEDLTADTPREDRKTQSFQEAGSADSQNKHEVTETEKPKESSLGELLQKTKAYDNKEVKTVSLYEGMSHIDPVVGWLVCVKGDVYGYSYVLKTGKNYIGRHTDMDICISGDNTVSRENHAVLMFEPQNKEFILLNVESKGLVYVNGEVIKENTTLRAKDIITIGQTLLLFIPLCDDEFDWSNPEKINRASGIQEKKYPETTVTSYRIYEPQTTVLTSASVNVQEKAEEKQTWLCPICNAANSVSSGFCQMCGAPRG